MRHNKNRGLNLSRITKFTQTSDKTKCLISHHRANGPSTVNRPRPALGREILVGLVAIMFSGGLMNSNAYAQQPTHGVAEGSADDSSLVIGTFNIRYNNRGDGEDAWPHRKQHVANVILDAKADIVGLQEALREQVQDLEKALPDHDWFGVGRDDGESAGEYVPIFYRRDRFDVVKQGHFWLSTTPEVPGSKSWDAAITRMVSWLVLKDKRTHQEFLMANTHFDHRGAVARRESATLLRKELPKLAEGRPLILTGDFNCLSTDPPYKVLVAEETQDDPRLFDSRAIASNKPQGPESTWSGFRKVEPGRRIDFVFVSSGVEVSQHATIDRTFDGRFPSDHLPVFVQLELAAKDEQKQ